MIELDRRLFLKLGLAAVAGGITGEVLLPITAVTVDVTKKMSKTEVGNAGAREYVRKRCVAEIDQAECIQSYKPTDMDKIMGVIFAPLYEEAIFRGLPSLLLTMTEDAEKSSKSSLVNGGFNMTKREVIIGAISSIFFGGMHNINDRGLDTETIPTLQIIGSFPLWYLQRKFGIVSNVIAHALFNFRLMNKG